MALLPYLVHSLVDDVEPLYYYPVSLNRHIAPSVSGLSTPLNAGYLRMMRHLEPEESGISSVEETKEDVQISLDVKDFKPNEVKVKVADNYVVVEGKHEERKDEHGFVSRRFTRKYRLPPYVKTESVSSSLSSDGLLKIKAPKKTEAIQKSKVREIKVVQTNKPALKDSKAAAGDQQERMET